jgi:gliding motility-associated-like protein
MITKRLIACTLAFLGAGLLFPAWAQNISVNSTAPRNNPQWLAQNVLVGPNFSLLPMPINLANNMFLNQGPSPQIGKFTFPSHNSNFGLDSGIVMVTGGANDVVPGQTGALGNGASLSANLLTVLSAIGSSQTSLNDKAQIMFSFIAPGDSVKFDYVFASNEYAGYTCTQFNDAFGFFLIGKGINGASNNVIDTVNLAKIPGTNVPVAVNTINGGAPTGVGTVATCLAANPNFVAHSVYFNNNVAAAGISTGYSGFTDVFTAKARVQCGQLYTIKMIIADVADGSLNSAVFLGARSFQLPTITLSRSTNSGNSFSDTNVVEGCKASGLIIERKGATTDTMNIAFTQNQGTAQPGVDFTPLPSVVTLLPGQTRDTVWIQAFDDGVAEGPEIIQLVMQPVSTFCADYPSKIVRYRIRDKVNPAVSIALQAGNDTLQCPGDQATFVGTAAGGEGVVKSWWNTDTTGGNQLVVAPTTQTTYYFYAQDECMGTAVVDSVTVYFQQVDTLKTIPASTVICPGAVVKIGNTGYVGGAYSSILWETGQNTDSISVSPAITRYYKYTLTGDCGFTRTDSVWVQVMPVPNSSFGYNVDGINPLKVRFQNLATPHSTWSWNFGDGTPVNTTDANPIHTYAIPGRYNVTLVITDTLGCSDAITLEVVVQMDYYFYVPTGFTPNGDRVNDYFLVKGLGIEGMELQIFNRWGNVIYTSTDITQGWDGTFGGQPAQDGVYSYRVLLHLPLGKKAEETGVFTLYR